MRIGEVAEQAGVNVETLRYYERRGLLPEPVRSPGGHRDYGDDAVRFVRAVKEAQTLGFSLGEIEEYMAVTRRDSRRAPTAARERLERKLADLDTKLEVLQRMRTGVVGALYAGPAAMERSTSTTAYIARRGAAPQLRPGNPLHVTNGQSAAGTLEATSLGGVVLAWNDTLHVGPLAFESAESRRLRAQFLAAHGWGDERAIASELERRDELLELAAGHRVVLWFEHDLYDQLQLLQILAQLPRDSNVELVQSAEFLGPLDADGFEALWPQRRRLGPETLERARRAWRGVVEGDLEHRLPELPFLESALSRLAEEREPLSRTKRQLLSLLASGPRTPRDLFVANNELEDAPFLGDSWCFLFLYELAQERLLSPVDGGSTPLPPPRGDHDTFVTTPLRLPK